MGFRQRFEKSPILIGGCGRSGTTLLLAILSAHPNIYAIPYETWSFWPTETSNEFRSLIKAFEAKLETLNIPATYKRWCEKTPKNVQSFGRLLECFGSNIRLIHIVRDGRDVITSIHPHDPTTFWVPLERWIEDVTAGLNYEGHPQVLTIRYEDLILHFKTTIKTLCEFIEEPCNDYVLSWHKYATVRHHSAWNGDVKPIFTQSIGKWKNPRYQHLIDELMNNKKARSLLKHFHYHDVTTQAYSRSTYVY